MDIKTETNALKLIKQILDGEQAVEPVLPFRAQKPAFRPAEEASPLARSTPEAQGVDSDLIRRYFEALAAEKETQTHTLTVVRHGRVIAQTALFPYRAQVWHITHSLCKSVTGLAVGLLYDDGRIGLDDRLSDFFGKGGVLPSPARNLTVRQLLTMSTGVLFNEAGTVTEEDWVKCYLESLLKFEPGAEFDYNSMNSYMLAALVREVSGKSVCALLDERIFSRMGITNYFWETCPMGREKGGMGMYLLPEDMAKIGLLYLQKGSWNGERLISEAWVTMATTAQFAVPEYVGVYDYGFQVWVRKGRNYFALNGMFGQNVLAFPDNDLLVVVTAGNDDMFQQNRFFEITEQFFGPRLEDKPIVGGWRARARLRRTVSGLESPPPARRGQRELRRRILERLDGQTYVFDPEEGKAVGVLPLIVQAVQNNYTRGLRSVSFRRQADGLLVSIEEEDETIRFTAGWQTALYSEVAFHGEPYLMGAFAVFTSDEDDLPVLKLRLVFPEIANEREIKFFLVEEDRLRTRWSEQPSDEFLYRGLKSIYSGLSGGKLVQSVMRGAFDTLPRHRIRDTFHPEVTARLAQQKETD